jgi:Right handed beta helix region
LTTVKKVSLRRLMAVAIMLALILAFYSLPDAQAADLDPFIECSEGDDIDQVINNDPKTTATRFELEAGCTFVASETIVPSDGDVVACEVDPVFTSRFPAFDPTTKCTVAGNSSVENVFRPIGQGGTTATVHFRGITITGGNYTGSSGSGAAIAEGSMTNRSTHYGIEVMDNGAAGILSAKGTFERVEFTDNTNDPDALSVIGAGLKARNEVEVKNSYVHETQGNGLWCDGGCVNSTDHPNGSNGFWVHDNLVVDNDRAGIRYENSTNAALIEDNEVHGNSYRAKRGGISVHDAQDAVVRNNVFGRKAIAGVTYEANAVAAIRCSDSGRSGRPNLQNVQIGANVLNGETIKGC